MTYTHQVIIIGSGPAGLTAAIYAARAGLSPLVIGGYVYGGQLMNTTVVENYPGFINGVDGPELMDNMLQQARRFGAEVKYIDAQKVEFSASEKRIFTAEGEFTSPTVIIATGAQPRRLGVPGEDKYYGHGVSTCATCDGALYREKTVLMVGGGDSAMEEALFLARHAAKVYIAHRRDEFRASKIMADRVLGNPKIEVLWSHVVEEIVGEEDRVHHVILRNTKNQSQTNLEVNGVFLAIGHVPVTGFLGGQLQLTENGYINSGDGVQTSVPGVFVAGDVQDQIFRQAVTAAGMGCRAALTAQKYLESLD